MSFFSLFDAVNKKKVTQLIVHGIFGSIVRLCFEINANFWILTVAHANEVI